MQSPQIVNFIQGDKQYILESSYPCDQSNIASNQVIFNSLV